MKFENIQSENVEKKVCSVTPSSIKEAVRALAKDKIIQDYFRPSNFKRGRLEFDSDDPEDYSVSLYDSIENLVNALNENKYMRENKKYYAICFNESDKGVAWPPSNLDGHIHFFLYNYSTYQPDEDFEVGGEIPWKNLNV